MVKEDQIKLMQTIIDQQENGFRKKMLSSQTFVSLSMNCNR